MLSTSWSRRGTAALRFRPAYQPVKQRRAVMSGGHSACTRFASGTAAENIHPTASAFPAGERRKRAEMKRFSIEICRRHSSIERAFCCLAPKLSPLFGSRASHHRKLSSSMSLVPVAPAFVRRRTQHPLPAGTRFHRRSMATPPHGAEKSKRPRRDDT